MRRLAALVRLLAGFWALTVLAYFLARWYNAPPLPFGSWLAGAVLFWLVESIGFSAFVGVSCILEYRADEGLQR